MSGPEIRFLQLAQPFRFLAPVCFLLGQPRDESFRCFLLLRDCSLEIFSLLRHR